MNFVSDHSDRYTMFNLMATNFMTTSNLMTKTSRLNDEFGFGFDRLEEEIARLRTQIQGIKYKRECERERFAESQGAFATRQYIVHQTMSRLLQRKTAIPRRYGRCIQKLSRPNEPFYVIAIETEVSHALHQIEINEQQLLIIRNHCDAMTESLKKAAEEETSIGAEIKCNLLARMKTIADWIDEHVRRRPKGNTFSLPVRVIG
eukprot:CAMPEP_0194215120 /NCGR_PEP_ID=MMETSP0156-20130528/16668_1 /TAXON_ID=33649 /ORGANISM="Thalassionema nitzschioides, Strain L26-B" /LENGTH=203 /DNA_ID=CAMNT_0038943553 /DNA_START=62 /DNA_END=673 /DNA_ORIENTATION=-